MRQRSWEVGRRLAFSRALPTLVQALSFSLVHRAPSPLPPACSAVPAAPGARARSGARGARQPAHRAGAGAPAAGAGADGAWRVRRGGAEPSFSEKPSLPLLAQVRIPCFGPRHGLHRGGKRRRAELRYSRPAQQQGPPQPRALPSANGPRRRWPRTTSWCRAGPSRSLASQSTPAWSGRWCCTSWAA